METGLGVRRGGVDEAGRGAWAGPVVAAAVVLPRSLDLLASLVESPTDGVRDSKLLSRTRRNAAAILIRGVARGVGVGIAPREVVDTMGLAFAGQLAFYRAVRALREPPDFLIVDGFPLWSPAYRQAAVLQGDQRCLSIAAASIIAKVTRDEIMVQLDREAPAYGFDHNCGYGTAQHRRALEVNGPSRFHRVSFQPVAAALVAHESGQ